MKVESRFDELIPFQRLQEAILDQMPDENAQKRITELFRAVCSDQIADIKLFYGEEKTDVQINLTGSRHKHLKVSLVYIPKRLRFEICKDFIRFKSDAGKNTPYNDQSSYCGLFKSRLTWWIVSVKENDFEFTNPHWFGLLTPHLGGTPVVQRIPTQKLITEAVFCCRCKQRQAYI